jgi:hypothetical protein
MEFSRRLFTQLLAGIGPALAQAKEVTVHRVLKRPYRWQSESFRKDGFQFTSMMLRIESTPGPVRIKIGVPGEPSLTEGTNVIPQPFICGYSFKATGLAVKPDTLCRQRFDSTAPFNGLNANIDLRVWVESQRPFKVITCAPNYRKIQRPHAV